MNGKVERSHRVDEQEFYQLLDKGKAQGRLPRFFVGGEFVSRPAAPVEGCQTLERRIAHMPVIHAKASATILSGLNPAHVRTTRRRVAESITVGFDIWRI
jgi:hypothetical protein